MADEPCPRCGDEPKSHNKLTRPDGSTIYCLFCETEDEFQSRKREQINASIQRGLDIHDRQERLA